VTTEFNHSSLGGFLRAAGRLEPDSESMLEIARLFGIELDAPNEAELAPPSRRPLSVSPPPPPIPQADPPRNPQQSSVPAASASRRPSPSSVGSQTVRIAHWSGPRTASAPTPTPAGVASAIQGARALELEPLLRPMATRAIVSSSLAQRNAGGPIDMDRLVELTAQRQNISELPRQLRWSIAGHTLVLVDRGAGMTPFARDAADLLERIRAVASRDRTVTRPFWRTPKRTRMSSTAESELIVPARGTAVVALTDLGIAPAAPTGVAAEWIEYAQLLRASGSSLVIFVPYPPERWPELTVELPLVSWDRPTTLATVLAAARPRIGR